MWTMKSSNIVPRSTFSAIGLDQDGLLIASLSVDEDVYLPHDRYITISKYNSSGYRILLDTIYHSWMSVDEYYVNLWNIHAICSDDSDIYLIMELSKYYVPHIVKDNEVVPLGYHHIDNDGMYIYPPGNKGYSVHGGLYTDRTSTKNHCTLIDGLLIFYKHHGNHFKKYDTRGTDRYRIVTDDIGCKLIEGSTLPNITMPDNVYKFINGYSSGSIKVTGLLHIDNYIILMSYLDLYGTLIVRYNIEDGSYIDSLPVKMLSDGRYPEMGHVSSNGRLIVGVSRLPAIVYVMDKDINIISYFYLTRSLRDWIQRYDIDQVDDVIIDHEDNIHVITSDGLHILTMDLKGKLLNVLSAPKVQRSD